MKEAEEEFKQFVERLHTMHCTYDMIFILWQIKQEIKRPGHIKKIRNMNDRAITVEYNNKDIHEGKCRNIAQTDYCLSIAEDLYEMLICDDY